MAANPRIPVSSILNFDEPLVTLIVDDGDDQRKFVVHRSHLERSSPVFLAAFGEQWKEGKDREITLKDDDSNTVHLYLHYLYTRTIPTQRSHGPPSADPHKLLEYGDLIDLYCFGEKYQDVRLKNAVVDAIIAASQDEDPKGSKYFPNDEEIDTLYKSTCAGSPVRKLMVDMQIKDGLKGWLTDSSSPINPDFLLDLALQHHCNHTAADDEFDGYKNSRYYEKVKSPSKTTEERKRKTEDAGEDTNKRQCTE